MPCELCQSLFFFFNDTATTEIYTLSLHDALPISARIGALLAGASGEGQAAVSEYASELGLCFQIVDDVLNATSTRRSEEHTSELQSRQYLVCRLLLEKKKTHMPHLAPLSVTAVAR